MSYDMPKKLSDCTIAHLLKQLQDAFILGLAHCANTSTASLSQMQKVMNEVLKEGADAYKAEHKGAIETVTGRLFNVKDENPPFDIKDIAHGLSMITRWNGQCRKFYSVAEHSIIVSNLMEALKLGDPLEGLLHDGTEAYLSDVPSPIKQFLPDWQAVDKQLEGKLRAWAGIGPKTVGCKQADWIALCLEALALMPSKGVGPQWVDDQGFLDMARKLADKFPIKCMTTRQAKTAFMKRFKELKRRQRAEEIRKAREAYLALMDPPTSEVH